MEKQFQPASQPFKYPEHNSDFGVEQDFLEFLLTHAELTVQSASTADWHYLPIFWTRWHLNHDYAKFGLTDLQREVDRVMLDDKRTFTICQYDDGPLVALGETAVFLASRKTSEGIDIPVLCSAHRRPFFKPRKRYLASFVGRVSTHPIRQGMFNALKGRNDVYLYDGNEGSKFYAKRMLESWVALCPRGYGGSSFRFFEAMQLGVVPFLIGELDTRPFKKWIDWDKLSLYSRSVSELNDILDSLQQVQLKRIGKNVAMVWKEELTYQKWCTYLVRELESMR